MAGGGPSTTPVWHAALARPCGMRAEWANPHCAKCHRSLACPALLPEVMWLPSLGLGKALLGGQPDEGCVECILEQSISGHQRAHLSSDTLGKGHLYDLA